MIFRRLIDVAVAASALLLFSPLFLLLAVAVWLDSPGNPFYLGWRTGKDGRLFRIWKFRTMAPEAPHLGLAITGKNDPRVTRLGHFLRRAKLDELPQFINVLIGDMTLVGPRPEAPEIAAIYTERQRQVLRVKPGITGLTQLEAGCEEDQFPEGVDVHEYYVERMMPQKVNRDLQYLESRTAFGDFKLVVATAGLVLRSLFVR